MTIAIVSVDAFPRMGGISTMAHHLANAMMEHEDVVFVAPEGSYVPRERVRNYRHIEDIGAAPKQRSGPDALAQDERIALLFRRIIDRYAVRRILLLHPFYYGVGAIDAAHEANIPVSVFFHGFEIRSQLLDGYPRKHRRILGERRIESLRERTFFTLGLADELLANSHYTASILERFEVRPRVRVTGCGIPLLDLEREIAATPRFDLDSKRRRAAAFDLGGGGPCLCYAGRLVQAKQVDRLLRFCAIDTSFNALIIGTGPDQARLECVARDTGVAPRVRFLGHVSESAKWAALRAADFICLLSLPDDATGQVEGFGIALLEGAACAAVPVSSGTGGMRDVVEHGSTGVLAPDRDDDACLTLSELAEREVSMRRIVEQAREQLTSKHNWNRVSQRILSEW